MTFVFCDAQDLPHQYASINIRKRIVDMYQRITKCNVPPTIDELRSMAICTEIKSPKVRHYVPRINRHEFDQMWNCNHKIKLILVSDQVQCLTVFEEICITLII
eukprot:151670_1